MFSFKQLAFLKGQETFLFCLVESSLFPSSQQLWQRIINNL